MTRFEPRELRADEVQVRKGNYIGEDKSKVDLLLFADARACMDILDEAVGEFGWACNYREEKGILMCGIAIKDPESGVYIWKYDAGGDGNIEPEKSVASSSFKRAAARWGVSRSLYSAPRIIVPNEKKAYKVREISYEDHKITGLVITDNYGNVVYDMSKGGATGQQPDAPKYTRDEEGLKQFVSDRWATADKDGKHQLSAFYNDNRTDSERLGRYSVEALWSWFQKDLKEGKKYVTQITPQGVDAKPIWVVRRSKK